MPAKKKKAQIATYNHPADTRRNIPTAEVEQVMGKDKRTPITLQYERSSRNNDLDPQLIWRGKDERDQSDLVVTAPPDIHPGESASQSPHRRPSEAVLKRNGL